MTQRRIVYLTVLLGSLVFFLAYREWLSGLLLMGVLLTPPLSLLLTLPAMLTCRVQLRCPSHVTMGTEAAARYEAQCRLPAPELRGKLRATRPFAGKPMKISPGSPLPTTHCGAVELRCRYVWMCDYLGILCLPILKPQKHTLYVHPLPVKPAAVPDVSRFLSVASRPKPGGGYSENHELRLYRPGDSLRMIHWKLSAKAGKLILREPMEALGSKVLLTLELSGSARQLDDKLGRLLWLSRYLLERDIPHQICCFTGSGLEQRAVGSEAQLQEAMSALLVCRSLTGSTQPVYPNAAWRYHIGGDGDAS